MNELFTKLQYCPEEIHARNGLRAIVLLSGGMDSTVALWWALLHYRNVDAITVDYNQPHRMEVEYASKLAELTGTSLRVIHLDLPEDFWGLQNYLTRGQAGLMTGIAALDIGHEGADIVHGILRTDAFGDVKRDHLDRLADILSHPEDIHPIGLATPLRAVADKQAAAALGFYYGAPFLSSWSCRHPADGKPCGECAQCQARKEVADGFEERFGIRWDEVTRWQDVLGSPMHPVVRDELPEDLYVLKEAFLQAGCMDYASPVWRYNAPDGTVRAASLIKEPAALLNDPESRGGMHKAVTVSGWLGIGQYWEFVIFDDGKTAFTDEMPERAVVEEKLLSLIRNGG